MSSRRKKADKAEKAPRVAFVARPFAGLPDETEWVALREIVPAATAPLRVRGSDATVTLSTVLPLAWPGMVTVDGRRMLGLQVASRSGDASRDVAWVLEQVLAAGPGTPLNPPGLPDPGPRLQDLLEPAQLDVTVHDGFDYWLENAQDSEMDDAGEIAASMERANATVVPTARLTGVPSAYWCRMRERAHLRWVLPEDEEPLLDALARMAVDGGLGLGEGTRYVGSFRAHGLLCPVWDLPVDMPADDVEEPVAAFRARLDEALTGGPLTDDARRARAGLLNRQLTLR